MIISPDGRTYLHRRHGRTLKDKQTTSISLYTRHSPTVNILQVGNGNEETDRCRISGPTHSEAATSHQTRYIQPARRDVSTREPTAAKVYSIYTINFNRQLS